MTIFRKTRAEINLLHLENNLNEILNLAGPDRFVCPMIKANAYGHGAVQVAKTILKNKIIPLGVALIEEALELRQAGIKSNILVFSDFDHRGSKSIIEAQLTPVISDFNQLRMLEKNVDKEIAVHIKLNTGMNRRGFNEHDIGELIHFFNSQVKIKIQGLLSHFHSAYQIENEKSSALAQLKLFSDYADHFKKFEIIPHILNSDAIAVMSKKNILNSELEILFKKQSWGFRPGLMLYGYHDQNIKSEMQLYPVMNFKSVVVGIQKIKTGESVSYNATWVAKRNSMIAIVSAGYADGVHRAMSNKGFAFINNQKVSIVGNICMDYLMLDVTDLKSDALVDADVVFFSDSKLNQSAVEFAAAAGTISYEALTSVSSRVNRIYTKEKL